IGPERDRVLNVGRVKGQPGAEYREDGFDCGAQAPGRAGGRESSGGSGPALLVGTAERPVEKTALIRLQFVEGMNRDSCPGIVACGGAMHFHGRPMSRTWVKLGETAKVG